jgi:transcriptional regulator GlxA family with amidase domain
MKKRTVALLLFDDVEVLDFAGPFEVFSVTNELNNYTLFDILTVAQSREPIRAKNGLVVQPDHAMADVSNPDIVIIPGGSGTRAVLCESDTMAWVQTSASNAELVLSICTGSLILAALGLLSGLRATTHHENLDELSDLAPDATIVRDERYIDNGQIITSGGISAGIDMSLGVVERLMGAEARQTTASYMEWRE